MESASEAELVSGLHSLLCVFLGASTPRPTSARATGWGRQELTRGSYSYMDTQSGLHWHLHFYTLPVLEGAAHYAGLLLAPAEGFGLRPRLFLPFGQKKSFLYYFGQNVGNFW